MCFVLRFAHLPFLLDKDSSTIAMMEGDSLSGSTSATSSAASTPAKPATKDVPGAPAAVAATMTSGGGTTQSQHAAQPNSSTNPANVQQPDAEAIKTSTSGQSSPKPVSGTAQLQQPPPQQQQQASHSGGGDMSTLDMDDHQAKKPRLRLAHACDRCRRRKIKVSLNSLPRYPRGQPFG